MYLLQQIIHEEQTSKPHPLNVTGASFPSPSGANPNDLDTNYNVETFQPRPQVASHKKTKKYVPYGRCIAS